MESGTLGDRHKDTDGVRDVAKDTRVTGEHRGGTFGQERIGHDRFSIRSC